MHAAPLRVAFLGTAPFAVPSLRAVHAAGHDVAVVVTQPERTGSRGRPAPRPVADAARELGLALWQPERVRDPRTTADLLGRGLDALVVAAYGQILPAALLDGVRLGGVNVHASLLPRWRGAAPVAAAILAGDAETGVSIMRMEAGLDTGPVYATERLPIGPHDTTPVLTERLAALGAHLLVRVLAELAAGVATAVPQPEEGVTHAPRLTREDGRLEWSTMSADDVDRRVRALQPWPGTVATLAGAEVRILEGGPAPGPAGAPGAVVAVEGATVTVACREDAFAVTVVQPPGRRPMDAAAYLRGRRPAAGS